MSAGRRATTATGTRPAPDAFRDTCGYAVPFMNYVEDRPLHASRFARETDASLDAYFHKKEHVATSIDGLPGLPLPLPPLPPAQRCAALAQARKVFGGAGFDDYLTLASRVSGLPITVTRAGGFSACSISMLPSNSDTSCSDAR